LKELGADKAMSILLIKKLKVEIIDIDQKCIKFNKGFENIRVEIEGNMIPSFTNEIAFKY
jgi:hypothetical protein